MVITAAFLPACLFAWAAILPLAATGAAPAPRPAASGATDPDLGIDLATARRLTLERDFRAANVLYERCLARAPGDSEIPYLFGLSLNVQAMSAPDAAAARSLRLRARQQLLRARELGSQEPLLEMTLDALKPDGSPPPSGTFSTDQEVDLLMKTAEAAYNRGDYARAADLHQQALAIQPRNYAAALLCGDAYFAMNDYGRAGEWFARAVAIDPDIETAHRYWADALERQRAIAAATTEYIEAVVAEPYNRLTRVRFEQYAHRVGLPLHQNILPLAEAVVVTKDGKPEVQIASGRGEYAQALDLAYGLACAEFRSKDFARFYPREATPRHSLPEEVAGLHAMLRVAAELTAAKPADLPAAEAAQFQPALERLRQIDHDGLIEDFILLDRPDQDLAKDYAAYRDAHRPQLIRYIRVYWCGLK